MELFKSGKKVKIYCGLEESDAVKIAAENLVKDIESVCNCEVLICNENADCDIVISTIGTESIKYENVSVNLLYDENDRYRKEAFLQQTINDKLYIIGTDRRGTIYGIYDLSEKIGVSPWYYFADVPVKKKDTYSLPEGFINYDYPSVEYRGIFLNDEEELDAWAKKHTADGTIGPETYEKIFELLLRLKANYIWPAMHVNYFNQDKRNGKLANKMGIVVGTSHCDMLLRSNQNEWRPWLAEKGYEAKYDYSISGANREILHEYWKESVILNKEYDVSYTVGMRGIHDSGFSAEKIDRDEGLTTDEKQNKKIELLEEVICNQQKIIKEVHGEEQSENYMQVFIPYKEVLDLYNKGLKVPEDITIMWVDDNFGYMRNYPNDTERARVGGHGLYYHASYWAFPGMSYLFFNSNPLSHTGNELKKCYESGIQKVWVLNVGALKPLEVDMEYFLRYGWDAGKNERKQSLKDDVFLATWLDRNFTIKNSLHMAELYNRCMQLTNVCKLEHMQTEKFSQESYGDEGFERLTKLSHYYTEANKVYEELPDAEKESFFQTILMKIQSSFYVNASFYYGDRSKLCFKRGAMQAADYYTELSRAYDNRKRQLIHYYNYVMSKGKWEDILTPESFTPPPMALYPMCRPSLVIDDGEMDVFCEDGKLIFEEFGESEKYFDIFNTGCGEIEFNISCPDWLKIDETKGKIDTEFRVYVEYKGDFNAERHGVIEIVSDDKKYEIMVEVCPEASDIISENDFMGPLYLEADGYVSMEAGRYQIAGENIEIRENLGRGRGEAIESAGGNNAWVKYNFYTKSEGEFLMELHRFVTLRPNDKIRFEIKIDDFETVTIQSDITDEWRGTWRNAVMNNGEKLYYEMPYLSAGVHSIIIKMPDKYTTVSKLVVYTKGYKKSNMGPDYSKCLENGQIIDYGRIKYTMTDKQFFYADTPDKPLELPMLYADRDFWKIDRLYIKSDEKQEKKAKATKYFCDNKGKKNVFAEFGTGYFVESEGGISIETEYSMENSKYAYTKKSSDNEYEWVHTQAETDGGRGIAMVVDAYEKIWHNPLEAPSMNFSINLKKSGLYHIWILVKFDDDRMDSCYLALDGKVQDLGEQFGRGHLYTYSMKQRWNWRAISDMYIEEGNHTFSVLAREAGLRIDRIYITESDGYPPEDADFKVCRGENS